MYRNGVVCLEFRNAEKVITGAIGVGVFLPIATYLLALVLFGRVPGIALGIFIGELFFLAGLLIIFFRRGYHGRALVLPIAAGILVSLVIVGVAIVIGVTVIHAPLPPPDFPEFRSGSPMIGMAVRTDEISTPSPEAKELLVKGLITASRDNAFEAALVYYNQAIAIDPDFTEAWMAKGVALHNLGSYAEAVACLDRALAIDPADAAAWSLRGIILDSWGCPDEAAACYRKARELDSRYQPI